MNTHDENNDWHDALIDRGLAEIVGGETPPDLSERILAAAAVAEPANLYRRERSPLVRNERPWIKYAVAALLCFVVVGLLIPVVPAGRERARSSNNLAQLELEGIDLTQKRRSVVVTDGQDNPELTDLQMAVTPHIIIQEDEEERLGIASEEESVDDSQFPAFQSSQVESSKTVASTDTVISGRVKPQNLSESAPASIAPARSPDVAENALTFGLSIARDESKSTPTPYYSGDDVELDVLSGKREDRYSRSKKYVSVDLSGKAPGVRFRIDAALGSKVDRYFADPKSQWGSGSDASGDQYTRIQENPFITATGENAVSTFSIDVDTASYANVRQFLEQSRQLPPPDAVRIEELINYFDYDYAGPTDDTPLAAHMEVAECPWQSEHRLARIAIKGREIDRQARPQSNLVFLIDVSGSMNEPNKLPLLIEGMKLLTRELGENDKVAIVVYASSEGLALGSTRGDQQQTILAALDQLRAGGSTAGGAGINLAYQVAQENFIKGGVNRVILCTDGDFNVGVTSTSDLERLAEQKAKTGVFLTVLGFGRGNLNDAMMEAISGKGNGNYHYVDNLTEARKVLVEEMTGTLVTIAKDVKIQVEFNPAQVAGYRLIGYENRMLRTEDFNDDKKDAGEIGAGHTVTALYEIVPAGKAVSDKSVNPLKYQPAKTQEPGGRGGYEGDIGAAKPQAASDELLTLKLRYKLPDGDTSTKLEFPITDAGGSFADTTADFQFASAVASFGMLLRNSEYKGATSFDAVLEIAQQASSRDPHGYRAEFLELVRLAKELTGEQPSSTTDPSTTEGP